MRILGKKDNLEFEKYLKEGFFMFAYIPKKESLTNKFCCFFSLFNLTQGQHLVISNLLLTKILRSAKYDCKTFQLLSRLENYKRELSTTRNTFAVNNQNQN